MSVIIDCLSPAQSTRLIDQSTTGNNNANGNSALNMAKKRSWQLDEKYSLAEVSNHQTLDDCWMVIFDKVYDITQFVEDHPGGEFILLEYAGRDATQPFLNSRHGSSAYKMLDKYWIGILVDEELFYSNNSSYCSVYSNLSWKENCCVVDSELAQKEPKPGGVTKARDSGGGGGGGDGRLSDANNSSQAASAAHSAASANSADGADNTDNNDSGYLADADGTDSGVDSRDDEGNLSSASSQFDLLVDT